MICYPTSINVTTTAIIDYLSCVYRDYNAVTIGEFNNMTSYVNKRNNNCTYRGENYYLGRIGAKEMRGIFSCF